jgi:hypothetical protein
MSDDLITFLIFIAIVWSIAASVAVGQAARKRGGSMATWFFASLFLSPIFTAILLIAYLVSGANREKTEYT